MSLSEDVPRNARMAIAILAQGATALNNQVSEQASQHPAVSVAISSCMHTAEEPEEEPEDPIFLRDLTVCPDLDD